MPTKRILPTSRLLRSVSLASVRRETSSFAVGHDARDETRGERRRRATAPQSYEAPRGVGSRKSAAGVAGRGLIVELCRLRALIHDTTSSTLCPSVSGPPCAARSSRAQGANSRSRGGRRKPRGRDVYCGEFRTGVAAPVVGLFQHLFQRLAVLPDGSGVVFEVTSQFSASPAPTAELSPEDGIFFVRADGSGLRRLGPASRWPTFFVAADPPRGLTLGDNGEFFPVSPDGRTVALIDLGPFDAAGHEAPQIFLLDLRSGQRCQLTHHSDSSICCESFLNSRTILFHGSDAAGLFTALSVKTDCKNPDEKEFPSIMLPGGGRVVSQFEVAGANPHALYVLFSDRPAVNGGFVAELFLLDGKKLVQLTNFRRDDTDQTGGFIARGRVLFVASANPSGENPDEICQLFSIDTFGAHLRQLTHLPWDGRPPTGCLVPANISRLFLDPITGTVLFQSSCDPVGANPFGEQLFAMRPDGTGLRQLTNARGLTIDPDGTVHVELPGPFAYTSRAGG